MGSTVRVRLDLAYDGTDFAGWQAQPDRDTVQGRVEAAVGRLYRRTPGQRTPVVGAGRTDAGVHAEGQVAHFDAPTRIPAAGIRAGLNGLLPDAIRVLAAAEAAPDFHARFSAAGKTYRYHLLTEAVVSPLRSRYAWPVGGGLSREAMEEGTARARGPSRLPRFLHRASRGRAGRRPSGRSPPRASSRREANWSSRSPRRGFSATWSAAWWGPWWRSGGDSFRRNGLPRCFVIPKRRGRDSGRPPPGSVCTGCTTGLPGAAKLAGPCPGVP